MPGHGVTSLDTFQLMMAADTKFIDRFKKHVGIIAGMGIMAGNATLSIHNAMDIEHGFVFIQRVRFILVAGNANFQCSFSPELIAVITPVRVMTEGASSYQGRVAEFFGQLFFFPCMAGKAGCIDSAFAKTYSRWFGIRGLQMTTQALLIYGCAVQP